MALVNSRMNRLGAFAASAAIGGTYAWTCYYRRPLSSLADPELVNQARRPVGDLSAGDGTVSMSSSHSSFFEDTVPAKVSRAFTLSIVTGMCQAYLSMAGVSVEGLKRFHKYLDDSEATGRPILTVSNHMSVYDDPIIVSFIAPFSFHTTQTYRHRWGGCSEEICFKNKALASFFGSGKVLPIWRGGGLSQPMFAELANHLCVPGSWVHLFPEGCICQRQLNHSDVPSRRRSYMRWGVGKMIARAYVNNELRHAPLLLPFFHEGLEKAVPLKEDDGTSLRVFPKLKSESGENISIKIRFGEPIEYADLLESFIKSNGTDPLTRAWDQPDTKEALELYSTISARVYERLLELDTRATLH